MQITEAKIFNFGKLQEKEYHFAPGINVIYGPNEAGKTTLHAFLTAMLFGMEKNRGRASATDLYTRYEPWHAPSYYSGAIRFSVGGKPFYLERSFYHREKRNLLRSEADGEELSVECGDLTMLLGGIGKEAFGNTYDVPQCRVLEAGELAKILAEYLSDAAESKDGGTHVAKALGALDGKRKKLNADVKKLQESRQKEKEKLEIEQSLLEQDCQTLKGLVLRTQKELVNHINVENTKLPENELRQKGTELSGKHDRGVHGRVSSVVLAVLLGLNALLFGLYNYGKLPFIVTESILAILFVGSYFYNRWVTVQDGGRNEVSRVENIDDAESRFAQNEALAQVKRLLEGQKEQLSEKEMRIYNIKERIWELERPGKKEQELIEDMQALTLAMEEIERLAKEYGEEMRDELNGEVSRWTSMLTNGAYDSVRVDESGHLRVTVEGREIAPEALSRGTLEQFYLAFRIAVGEIVTGEEELPLFLDETFGMYDDRRLEETLQALEQTQRQVFLFTCQKREMELLDRRKVTYHAVDME